MARPVKLLPSGENESADERETTYYTRDRQHLNNTTPRVSLIIRINFVVMAHGL